ncbi:bacitracin transport system ATP-binding protein [Seinonella peptonophila]|uniref:Bacitracin transport system ATP-binding protein n=1 Tax=Seinonella peptonophila TaxID=112248 RepID=A0A1M4WED0_9BACL|nr:bacitracin transport system ATP-binding protein [Seinonella peptonophila]
MKSELPILKLTNLGKKYANHWAVRNLNLNLYQGEIYGFLGRNGAGKTTTIRMIMDLIKPTTGTIQLFGQTDIVRKEMRLRQIGATIEYPGFYPNLTARENLYYNAKMFEVDVARIDETLEFMGLQKAANRVVKGYSLGMKQRLGLARALLHQPKLLILDEPTNGLDPSGIKEIRELIQQLRTEFHITVLVSSHILSEIEQLADRVGMIHQGMLTKEIVLADLQQHGKQYIEIKVNNPQSAIQTLAHSYRLHDTKIIDEQTVHLFGTFHQPAEINRHLHQAGFDVSHFTLRRESLEDHFLRITGGFES